MKGFVRVADSAGGVLAQIFMGLAALSLFALVPMAGWLVFGRYILNASPTWVEATSLILILIVTFGVAAAATRSQEHLAIDFVRDAAPRPIRRAMQLLSHTLMLIFGAAMLDASIINVTRTWSRDIPLLNIPEGLRHLPLVFAGVGIVLFSAIHILKVLSGDPDRKQPLGDPSPSGSAQPVAPEKDAP